MKHFVVLLAVVALAQGAKLKSHKPEVHKDEGIHDDLQEFVKIMPTEELGKIVEKYEKDIVIVSDYLLQSKEAIKAKEAILLLPEMQELMEFINDLIGKKSNVTVTDANIDEDKDLEADIDSDMHTTTVKPIKHKLKKNKKISSRIDASGYNDYIEEVMDVLPLDEMKALIAKQVKEGRPLGKLYAKIQGMEKFFNDLFTIPEVAKVIEYLEDIGVDFEKLWEANKLFMDWN